MTHVHEFSDAIRDPTPENAGALWSYVTPSEAQPYIPDIISRLDNHEDPSIVAEDSLFSIIDIVENQLTSGIDTVFNSGIVERISTMVINILNSVVQRATETLLG